MAGGPRGHSKPTGAGLLALYWLVQGYGDEITGAGVWSAYPRRWPPPSATKALVTAASTWIDRRLRGSLAPRTGARRGRAPTGALRTRSGCQGK